MQTQNFMCVTKTFTNRAISPASTASWCSCTSIAELDTSPSLREGIAYSRSHGAELHRKAGDPRSSVNYFLSRDLTN